MNQIPRRITGAMIAALLIVYSALVTVAQGPEQNNAVMKAAKTGVLKPGVLLLAHGGKQQWNDEVNKLAAQVNREFPTEIAFGMANKRSIQNAIDRLAQRGVSEIVAVPLFVSSHSSVITSTQYLLGLREDAPPELAAYAKMDHGHGEQHGGSTSAPPFDPASPIKLPSPLRMTAALDGHPLVAEILLARAQTMSRDPLKEVVVIVAHGPVSDEENVKWLADMHVLAERMRAESRFARIEYLTVRDDAPDPIRSEATAELRRVVERATSEGNKVLIVPLLLSYGGIEDGIKQRLAGLAYMISQQALLPDERLARWVLLQADAEAGRHNEGATSRCFASSIRKARGALTPRSINRHEHRAGQRGCSRL